METKPTYTYTAELRETRRLLNDAEAALAAARRQITVSLSQVRRLLALIDAADQGADPVTEPAKAQLAGHLDPSMAEQATAYKDPT